MIAWTRLANRLAALARSAAPGQMLSVTQALPHWPVFALPAGGDWCAWGRPETGQRRVGFGRACVTHCAGAGRFAALRAAERGLMQGWRYDDEHVPLAFAGFAFSPQAGAPLPNAALWVPEILLQLQRGKVWLTLSCPAGESDAALARARLLWQSITTKVAVPPAPTFKSIPNPLADAAFLARGRAALREIKAGVLDKLVLTHSQRLQGDAPFSPLPLLDALARRQPGCTTFGIGCNGGSLIGASPETLLALRGEHVSVDALAGTAWQASPLGLGADKNRREHDFVAKAIADALAGCCDPIVIPSLPETMQLDALTHLRRRITARRLASVSAFDLVARLHPTPAVGGTPTEIALDWLARHGETREAWYTGGIGWLDAAGNCDLAVALRCGWLQGQTATLYAGAGFVAGSVPEHELAETEAKFATMRTALEDACAVAQTHAA